MPLSVKRTRFVTTSSLPSTVGEYTSTPTLPASSIGTNFIIRPGIWFECAVLYSNGACGMRSGISGTAVERPRGLCGYDSQKPSPEESPALLLRTVLSGLVSQKPEGP